nr:MAG TPA: hypothetical protein [Caudoviricetes sp.]
MEGAKHRAVRTWRSHPQRRSPQRAEDVEWADKKRPRRKRRGPNQRE